MTRPVLPMIGASDASTAFGFGGSVAKLAPERVREIVRWAEKRGEFVVLGDGKRKDLYCDRLGEAHLLELPLNAFVHVFSVKCKHLEHINLLEGQAFLILLRWILRSRRRHCKRIVILVDSSVWLGAASKERSSSSLNRLFQKAAALGLACDIQANLILVPSAENASDVPYRGLRRRSNAKRRNWIHAVMRSGRDHNASPASCNDD